ncbi:MULTISPECIES: winged helix-turn-helix transcriptional regulator [unclassified Haloparvum]|uniref:winged helix-turn-helix transcriptional regulator n=1 Tax=Haloparvum sp. PAK95 TaxID=3418962 RepID=UPI003D2F3556
MTDTRATIADSIRTHPGIHFNELVESVGLATGQVQYHLKGLLSDEVVVEEQLYGRTHYYPPEYDQWDREALALLQRETAGDVVAYLLTNGPTRPATVAEDLDIARSTLEWHLDRHIEHGLVRKDREQGNRVTLTVVNAEQTLELLRDADPSLRHRLVDRFTRLVDRLLSV